MCKRELVVLQRLFLLGLACSFLLPLETSLGGVPVYAFDSLLFPLMVVWLADTIYNRREISISLAEVFLYALVSWIFITGTMAFDLKLSFIGGMIWLRTAVMFTIVRTTYSRVYTKRDVYSMAALLVSVQATLVLIQGLTQTDFGALNQYFGKQIPLRSYDTIGGYELLRAQGTLGNPNTVANWFVILLPLVTVGVPNDKNSYKKLLYLITILYGAIAVLLTMSVGSIVILLGCTVVSITIFSNRILTHRKWVLGGLGGLFSIGLIIGITLISSISTIRSLAIRIELIQFAISLAVKMPMFGAGYNNFELAIKILNYMGEFSQSTNTIVHNIPLLFLAETGVVGFILFTSFFVLLFRRILAINILFNWNNRLETAYFISFLGLLGISLLYTTLVSFQFLPIATAVLASGIAISTDYSRDLHSPPS